MRRLPGLLIAVGLTLGLAQSAGAQVMMGDPYAGIGPGFPFGAPYNYGYGYNSLLAPYGVSSFMAPPATFYSSGYSGVSTYVAPGTSYFSSGTYGAYPLGYGSGYGYPSYGYGGVYPSYGYGYSSRSFYGIPGGRIIGRVLGRGF